MEEKKITSSLLRPYSSEHLPSTDFLWYCSHSQTLPVALQSLTDTSCGTAVTHRHFLWHCSHSQTLPMALQSLTDTSYCTAVTHRHFLWHCSHSHTLPVALQSLTNTSCGTAVTHRHFLWHCSYLQTLPTHFMICTSNYKTVNGILLTLPEHSLLSKCHSFMVYE
jgi:hypothetical protein